MRDPLKSLAWYDKWIDYDIAQIARMQDLASRPSAAPGYLPQYVFEIAQRWLVLGLRRYCRGDPKSATRESIGPLLDAWERSEEVGAQQWSAQTKESRRRWALNLDAYIFSFWLVALASALDVDEQDWRRLILLIDNEGEDLLLDRVIAQRQQDRKIGAALCYPGPYTKLLEAIDAPSREAGALAIEAFVRGWYEAIGTARPAGSRSRVQPPAWYRSDRIEGAYFGFWCLEAVAVVKLFGVDDRRCRGLPNYPGDLLA